MGALAATVATRTGTASPGAPVAATDTISAAIIGVRGANLEILNGNAAVDNMTISDDSTTPSGAAAAANAPTVPAGTNKMFYISPKQVNPGTQVVTITHSVTTTVTYKLTPLDR